MSMKRICSILVVLICTVSNLKAINNCVDTTISKPIDWEVDFLNKLTESAKDYDFHYVLPCMKDTIMFSVKANTKTYNNIIDKEQAIIAINSMFQEVRFDSFDVVKYKDRSLDGEDTYSIRYKYKDSKSEFEVEILFSVTSEKITKMFLR